MKTEPSSLTEQMQCTFSNAFDIDCFEVDGNIKGEGKDDAKYNISSSSSFSVSFGMVDRGLRTSFDCAGGS